jgi:hypothetical protein
VSGRKSFTIETDYNYTEVIGKSSIVAVWKEKKRKKENEFPFSSFLPSTKTNKNLGKKLRQIHNQRLWTAFLFSSPLTSSFYLVCFVYLKNKEMCNSILGVSLSRTI